MDAIPVLSYLLIVHPYLLNIYFYFEYYSNRLITWKHLQPFSFALLLTKMTDMPQEGPNRRVSHIIEGLGSLSRQIPINNSYLSLQTDTLKATVNCSSCRYYIWRCFKIMFCLLWSFASEEDDWTHDFLFWPVSYFRVIFWSSKTKLTTPYPSYHFRCLFQGSVTVRFRCVSVIATVSLYCCLFVPNLSTLSVFVEGRAPRLRLLFGLTCNKDNITLLVRIMLTSLCNLDPLSPSNKWRIPRYTGV